MSAITIAPAIHAQRKTGADNPPLPFTKEAVIAKFRELANNGPRYVQLQAANCLARALGVYEEAKLTIRAKFKAAEQAEQTQQAESETAEAVGVVFDYSHYDKKKKNDEEDEEEAGSQDEDKPP